MKKVFFLFLLVLAISVSCKTKKAASGYVPPVKTDVEQTEVVAYNAAVSDLPITVKTEEVSVVDSEDQSHDGFAFYVIAGSFSKIENAAKQKAQLIEKGFTPVLLKGENSFIRVAVGHSNIESEARRNVLSIRANYPEHNDVWLLKKK